jgi:hypothetical protein
MLKGRISGSSLTHRPLTTPTTCSISCYLGPCLIGERSTGCVINTSRAFERSLPHHTDPHCKSYYFAPGISPHCRSTFPDLTPHPSSLNINMSALAQDKVLARDLKAKRTKSRNGCSRCKLKRVKSHTSTIVAWTSANSGEAQMRRNRSRLFAVQEEELPMPWV